MGLALDGSGSDDGTSGGVVTLTTVHSNDVIIAIVDAQGQSGPPLVAPPSDTAGLVWRQRFERDGAYEMWWAKAPNPLSADVITFSVDPSATYENMVVFGISGANALTPFDPASTLPNNQNNLGTGGTGTITTATANDFLFARYGSGLAGPSPGAGWVAIYAANFVLVQYKIVSTVQINTAIPATLGDNVSMLADALMQDAALSGGFAWAEGG